MTAASRARVPRLAAWLIERRFAAGEAEAILGDLGEEMAARVSRGESARLWCWRQVAASLIARRQTVAFTQPAAAGLASRTANDLWTDLSVGARMLRRAPAFAFAAIATLALGIGAAAAIGTAAIQVLLRPLPFPTGDRLVSLGEASDDETLGNVGFDTVADWRNRMSTIDELVVVNGWQPTLVTPNGAERLNGLKVSWNYFRMLGVRPALGRDFAPEDDTPATWRVIMLSDALWRSKFGADPSIVGKLIDFNTRQYRVAGVMPASFEPVIGDFVRAGEDVWAPLGYVSGGPSACRTCRHLQAIARLQPGGTIAAAQAELTTVHTRIVQEHPTEYAGRPALARSLGREVMKGLRTPVMILMGAVAFVLLVACANVAGLLMSRASGRMREFTLRAALGASRGRLVRQLAAESAMLSVVAGALGACVALAALALLAHDPPAGLPVLSRSGMTARLIGLSFALTAVTTLLVGVLPAWTSAGGSIEGRLRDARTTAGRATLRLREGLMALEVAAAVLIVAGGGLIGRTVNRLLDVDPGFSPTGVMTAAVSLVGQRWNDDKAVDAFQHALAARLSELPGVSAAGLAGQIPLGGNFDRWGFRVRGRVYANPEDAPSVERYGVTPGYFSALRIPLRRGRLFTDADAAEAAKVMLISDATARLVFPGEDPIGQIVRIGGGEPPRDFTIVGIVGDVRHYELGAAPTPQFYVPESQFTDSSFLVVVRGEHPEGLAEPIRRAVSALGSDAAVSNIVPFASLVTRSIGVRLFLMVLLGSLAGIALVLAGVGLYGVVAQTVAAGRRELGIRMALGASASSVVRLVARRGAIVVAIGAAAGLGAFLAAGRLLQSQLYETAPADGPSMAGAVGTLVVIAALAHLPPVRRALKVDPKETLTAD